jgi:hypothetical protein
MTDCTYCGSDVTRHDPIEVRDYEADASHGRFCHFACLGAHIDSEDLAVGDACEWEPAGE